MEELKTRQNKIFTVKIAKRIVFLLSFIFIFDFFLFPAPALASEYSHPAVKGVIEVLENIPEPVQEIQEINKIQNYLPDNSDLRVSWSGYYTMTAYNSLPEQCDNEPCITANGFNVCEHGIEDTIAANFLKFGTKVKIPELFGDRIFVVRDRMNKRYQNRVDIWMLDKKDAKKFGIKVAKIEVLESH